ncbi:extracellular solute-binding protein [Paenibacillus marinisediminis]
MPKKPKKLLLMVMVLVLLSSLFAACSSNKPSSEGHGSTTPAPAPSTTPAPDPKAEPPAVDYGDTGGIKLPIVDKPVELTWMVVSATENLQDKMIIKEIEKRTGIKIKLEAYSSATYQDKLRSVLASGKLPDIFHGLRVSEANKMGNDGAFAKINEHLDVLPNFKRMYTEELPWVMKSYSSDDGSMYTWPIQSFARDVNHGFLYRKDIFDKHGIKEWTNTDEFYDALKKLKEIYPNSYPYASKTKDYIFRDWAYGWGIGSLNFPIRHDAASNKWYAAVTSDKYKDMLDFMKKLAAEKLLDPEFLTDTQDNWTAKMTSNDKAFVTFDWIGRLDLFYNQVKAENPTYDLRYGNPVGPTGNIRTKAPIENWGHVVANNDKQEIALKLLDYLSSPSGLELVTMGVEGETFNFNAAGKPEYPGLKDVPLVDIKVLEENYGLWIEGMYMGADKRSVYYNFTEKEQEAQDKIVKGNKYELPDPLLKFTDEETAQIAEIQTSLTKAVNEFSSQYVLGANTGDKEWEAWKANAPKLGIDKLVEIFNAAQQRYDADK